jgi:hypothetical protein
MSKKLIPVDKKQCQAEDIHGSFLSLGIPTTIRCKKEAVWIAKEKKCSKIDGEKGRMSLCEKHKVDLIRVFGSHYATFTKIKK